MKRSIVFNHIPKTGGTTLRIILNRVYGEEAVFFINSRNIQGSLNEIKEMPDEDRQAYRVISGHAAEMFEKYFEDPFRISVLREPLSLFLSQYHYLKYSPNSNFLDEVSKLRSEEEYLAYAISKGQDNLLTRYLSGSVEFLLDPEIPIPDMEKEGDKLLQKAKQKLKDYDALLDLSNFDRGVFVLSNKLDWKRIPLYRPSNITRRKREFSNYGSGFLEKLKVCLRWDIELYDYFREEKLDVAMNNNKQQVMQPFLLRQNLIQFVASILGKK